MIGRTTWLFGRDLRYSRASGFTSSLLDDELAGDTSWTDVGSIGDRAPRLELARSASSASRASSGRSFMRSGLVGVRRGIRRGMRPEIRRGNSTTLKTEGVRFFSRVRTLPFVRWSRVPFRSFSSGQAGGRLRSEMRETTPLWTCLISLDRDMGVRTNECMGSPRPVLLPPVHREQNNGRASNVGLDDHRLGSWSLTTLTAVRGTKTLPPLGG